MDLNPTGIAVIVAASFLLEVIQGPWMSATGRNKIVGFTADSSKQDDLLFLKTRLETDDVVPVIDRIAGRGLIHVIVSV